MVARGHARELVARRAGVDIDAVARVDAHRVAGDVGPAIGGGCGPGDRDRPIATGGLDRGGDIGRVEVGSAGRGGIGGVATEQRRGVHREVVGDVGDERVEHGGERRRVDGLAHRSSAGGDARGVTRDVVAAVGGRRHPRERDRTIASGGDEVRGSAGSDHQRGHVGDDRLGRITESGPGGDRHCDGDAGEQAGELVGGGGEADVVADVADVDAHRVADEIGTAVGDGWRPREVDGTIVVAARDGGGHARRRDGGAPVDRGGIGGVERVLAARGDGERVITGGDGAELVGERARIDVVAVRGVDAGRVADDVGPTVGEGRDPRQGDRTITARGREVGGGTGEVDAAAEARIGELARGGDGVERGCDHRHAVIDAGRHIVERVGGGGRGHVVTIGGVEADRVRGDIGATVERRSGPGERERALTLRDLQVGGGVGSDDECGAIGRDGIGGGLGGLGGGGDGHRVRDRRIERREGVRQFVGGIDGAARGRTGGHGDAHLIGGEVTAAVSGRGDPGGGDRTIAAGEHEIGRRTRRHHRRVRIGRAHRIGRISGELGTRHHRHRMRHTRRNIDERVGRRRPIELMTLGGIETHRGAHEIRTTIGNRRDPAHLQRTLRRRHHEISRRTRRHHRRVRIGRAHRIGRISGELGTRHHRHRMRHTRRNIDERVGRRRPIELMTLGGIETHRGAHEIRTTIGNRRDPAHLQRTLRRRHHEISRRTRRHDEGARVELGCGSIELQDVGMGVDPHMVVDAGGQTGERGGARGPAHGLTLGFTGTDPGAHAVARDVTATIGGRGVPLDGDRTIAGYRRRVRGHSGRDHGGAGVDGGRGGLATERRDGVHHDRVGEAGGERGVGLLGGAERKRLAGCGDADRLDAHRVADEIAAAIGCRSGPGDRDAPVAIGCGEGTWGLGGVDDRGGVDGGGHGIAARGRGGHDAHRVAAGGHAGEGMVEGGRADADTVDRIDADGVAGDRRPAVGIGGRPREVEGAHPGIDEETRGRTRSAHRGDRAERTARRGGG